MFLAQFDQKTVHSSETVDIGSPTSSEVELPPTPEHPYFQPVPRRVVHSDVDMCALLPLATSVHEALALNMFCRSAPPFRS